MPYLVIPCVDCADRKRKLEMTGYTVHSCEQKPNDETMCVISYERTASAAEALSPAAPKAAKGFSLGKGSLRELEGVDDALVAVVRRAMELTGQDFAVHDGLRTLAEQQEMVKRGVSTTLESKHLVGQAVDLVPYVNGKLRWEWAPIYVIADAVRMAALEQGTRLRWGGAWDVDFTLSTQSPEDLLNDYADRRRAAGQRLFLDGPHYELLA
jgi:peptidoglycan L-alanyl-D-glutamate endopeptidase CwlK